MYQKMYITLFNAVTDALELMEDHDFEAAHMKLIAAQRETEQTYISGEDKGLPERRL